MLSFRKHSDRVIVVAGTLIALLFDGAIARKAEMSHASSLAAVVQSASDLKLQNTLSRMQWWVQAGSALPPTDKFVLFTNDNGGPNNIRMGWEMSGLVALSTKRTLVLPPPEKMYLLDFGPVSKRYPSELEEGSTSTKVEDLISLAQLKANLPTLTAEEFEKHTGVSWQDASAQSNRLSNDRAKDCDMSAYHDVQDKFLFMDGSGERREGFACAEWWKLGGPKAEMKKTMDTTSGYALLTHGFVWHDDTFSIASKVVNYLGLFNYMALHARYGDFQFHEDQQSPEELFKAWAPFLQPGSTLWLATDQPEKFRNALQSLKASSIPSLLQTASGARVVMWDDLFTEATGNLLTDTKSQYSPERWFKLTGPVEELICTYSQVFVGSKSSSFTGHIQRMRIHAAAPVTSIHYHTEKPVIMDPIQQEMKEWNQGSKMGNFQRLPSNQGNSFLHQREDRYKLR